MVRTTSNGGPMKTMLAMSVALACALAIAVLVRATEGSAVAEASADTAAAQTLTVRSSRYGRVLFDGRGRVLYGFTRDRRGGPSRCYGGCAKAWPVYFAKGTVVRAGAEVKKSLIGSTRRSDGGASTRIAAGRSTTTRTRVRARCSARTSASSA